MAPNNYKGTIVMSFPGTNTGDEIVITADGYQWKKIDYAPHVGTGDSVGRKVGNKIIKQR